MRREGLAVGLFFVAAGILFLLDAFELIAVSAAYLWPLLLIGFGIALIAGGRRREPEPAGPPTEPGERPAEEREERPAETREEPPPETEPRPEVDPEGRTEPETRTDEDRDGDEEEGRKD